MHQGHGGFTPVAERRCPQVQLSPSLGLTISGKLDNRPLAVRTQSGGTLR